MSYPRAQALLEKGLSRPTLYNVRLPVGSPGVNEFTREYVGLYCVSVSLPEASVETITANGHENMGIVRDQPTHMVYGKPLTLSLVADRDYNAYQSLRSWLDKTLTTGANQEGVRNQRMAFYRSYHKNIKLDKLEFKSKAKASNNESGGGGNYEGNYKRVLTFEFINAYPISLGAVSLGSDRTDSYSTFEVAFMYESFILNPD